MTLYFLVQWFKAILLPPLSFFWLLFIGLYLKKSGNPHAKKLILTGAGGLLIFSVPLFSLSLFSILEVHAPLDAKTVAQSKAQAIVLLGGGAHRSAPEYNGENISRYSLERMQYAAQLYHQTHLPVLITGGAPRDSFEGEARTMARVMREQFRINPKWIDDTAVNTGDNAINSARILHQEGINRILLVTHAMHMPRAEAIFKQQSLQIIPAPTGFMGNYENDSIFLLLKPSTEAWERSYQAFHELLGRIWYAIRY